MAPEVFLNKVYGRKVDVFAFGLVLQEVCLITEFLCSALMLCNEIEEINAMKIFSSPQMKIMIKRADVVLTYFLYLYFIYMKVI
jgi:serine/threonine protein kinase